MQNYTEAIKFGLNCVAASSVPLDDDQVDDDVAAPVPAPDVVHPYLRRTLPFYIGSNDFFRDELCGIKPQEEEEEMGLVTVQVPVPSQAADNSSTIAASNAGQVGSEPSAMNVAPIDSGAPPPYVY